MNKDQPRIGNGDTDNRKPELSEVISRLANGTKTLSQAVPPKPPAPRKRHKWFG